MESLHRSPLVDDGPLLLLLTAAAGGRSSAALLPAVPHIWDDRGRYGRYFISSKDILDSGDQYILQY